jgi:hypothetical protein
VTHNRRNTNFFNKLFDFLILIIEVLHNSITFLYPLNCKLTRFYCIRTVQFCTTNCKCAAIINWLYYILFCILESCLSSMTGKSKLVVRKNCIEKCNKLAYKNENHYLSLLNYKSCEPLTYKDLFWCVVWKYMYKAGHGCVNSLLLWCILSTKQYIKKWKPSSTALPWQCL